jgi:hypothetical protein
VQISTFQSTAGVELNTQDFDWGTLRDAQRRALALANTAMVVSLDVGDPDNIHPPDKETVVSRLTLAARALAYGEVLEYSGPLFRQAVPWGAEMCVSFDHANGLRSHGSSLAGFEVAGEDKRFFTATARISGHRIFAGSTKVLSPYTSAMPGPTRRKQTSSMVKGSRLQPSHRKNDRWWATFRI